MNAEKHAEVFIGPLREAGELSAGLDYYKPTMSQLAYEQEPDAEVTFTFHNRGQQKLINYIDPLRLQERFDDMRTRNWNESELNYLGTLQNSEGRRVFTVEYLDYLRANQLPEVKIGYDKADHDMHIETTGPWALATFWETIVMSEINEAYFEGYMMTHGYDLQRIYDEGDKRLSEKIAVLQANPDIKITDFGTRRHFSLRWQAHVVERLATECPNNLIGTSNVAIAHEQNLKPIGTFAHEMPMTYAGLADVRGQDVRDSHDKFLDDWQKRYGKDLSIALTDTFTSDFFFESLTAERARDWNGVRHDSGDPFEFGEKMIAAYETFGIDPRSKRIVFSDGLDINQIVSLHKYFKDRIGMTFGWGTTLTNDMGIKPLNVVMKATHVKVPEGEVDTVKLSDAVGKNTGPETQVRRYQHIFKVARYALANA